MDKDALVAALHKADAAGDVEGAKHLAQALRGMAEPAAAEAPAPEPAPQEQPAPVAPHKAGLLENIGGAIKEAFLPDAAKAADRGAENADNLKRGVGVVAAHPEKLAELGEQQVRSFTAPVGGDVVAAAGSAVAGKGFNPAEQRARRVGLEQEFGDVATAIPKTLGAAGVAGRVPGGPAASGAVTGGVTALNDTGDFGDAAAGAGTGGALGLVAKPLINMIKASDIPLGIKVLAKRLKMDPAELESTRLQYKQVTGQNPSVAELANPATIERLRPVVQSQPAVTEASIAARDTAEAARPDKLRAAVANGKTLTDPQEILARRDDAFNALVDPVRDKAGLVRPSEAKLLLHPDVIRSLDDTAKQQLIQAVETGKPAFLTVGQADTVRRSLGRAVQTASQDGANLGALKTARGLARSIGERIAPEYKTAMSAYERGGDLAKGAVSGEKVRTADTTATVNAAGRANADQAMGLELGTRNAIANDVGNSYGRSGNAAAALQDSGLRTRVAANMGQAEADRIAAVGQVESKAAENLDRLAPAPLPKQPTSLDDARTAMKPVLALSGRGSMGFVLDAAAGVAKRLASKGISNKTAKALADDLFNPAKSEAAVAALHRARLVKDVHDELAKGLATHAAAANTGQE